LVLAGFDYVRGFGLKGSKVPDYFPRRIQVCLRYRIDLSAVTFQVGGELGQTPDRIKTKVPRPGMAN
jgi:hypothetical protein